MHSNKSQRCPSPSIITAPSHPPAGPQSRHTRILMQFNEDIFKRNVLTDVECVVEGHVFKTHRAVLVCFSPYLKRKLLSSDGRSIANKIQIPMVGYNEFEILLRYMYTGNLEVDCNTFYDVYKATSLLEMQEAKMECLQMIDGKNEIRTYFYVFVVSKKLGVQQNCQKALQLITHRFEETVFSREFMQLNLNYALEILSAQSIGARSETIVYLAALNWLNHDFGVRGAHAVKAMECVRFSSMTMGEIVACYHPPFLTPVVQIPEVVMMLFRATCYIAAKSQGQESWFKQYASSKRVLTFECLPMELWHHQSPPHSASSAASRRTDLSRPEVVCDTRLGWDRENVLADRLVYPEEVVSDTRQETRHVGQKNTFGPSNYANSIPAEKEGAADIGRSNDGSLEWTSYNPQDESKYPRGQREFMAKRVLSVIDDFDEEIEADKESSLDEVIYEDSMEFIKSSRSEPDRSALENKNLPQRPQDTANREPDPKLKDLLKREWKGSESSESERLNQFVQVEKAKVSDAKKGVKHSEPVFVDTEHRKQVETKSASPRSKYSAEDVAHLKDEILKATNKSSAVPTKDGKSKQPKEKTKVKPKTSSPKVSVPQDRKPVGKQIKKEDGSILIIGGMDPKNLNKEIGGKVTVFDAKTNKWVYHSSMPEPRHNHCAAFLDNFLYVVGGCNIRETIEKNRYIAQRSCFKLDLKSMKWSNLSDLKYPRYDHGMVVHGGQLYVVGGQDEKGSLLKSMEIYDPRRNYWRLLNSNLCCGRKAMGVTVFDDCIYIAGGLIQSATDSHLQAVSHVDFYHTVEKRWHFNMYSLPGPRCFCSLAVWNGNLYCIGGMIQAQEAKTRPTDEVWLVDSKNELWKAGPFLPEPRMGGVAVTHGDNLYFLGGFDPDSDNVCNVIFLTPSSSSWEAGPPLPSHLFGLSVVSFKTK